jgi:hypothetical protein
MALKIIGKYGKLKTRVSRTGLAGKWRDLQNGHKQYRTATVAFSIGGKLPGQYPFKALTRQLGRNWSGHLLRQLRNAFSVNTVATCSADDCDAFIRTQKNPTAK